MTEQQLQCFVCVAEHLNFTKAAEELFLTVSTVTHHIQMLEAELNVKLFTRTTRTVQLTETGRIFYPDARDLLTKFELSKIRIQKADEAQTVVFRIGCMGYADFPIFKVILSKMREAFPHVRPSVVVDDYYTLEKQFKSKQLDVLLASRRVAEDVQPAAFHKIRNIKAYALMTEEFPCCSQEEFVIDPASDYRIILLHPRLVPFKANSSLQRDLLLYQQAHDFITCESPQTAILLAQSGYGIAVIPDFLLLPALPSLTAIPVRDTASDEYGLLFQSKNTYSRFFLKEYKAQIETSPSTVL